MVNKRKVVVIEMIAATLLLGIEKWQIESRYFSNIYMYIAQKFSLREQMRG